MLNNSQNAMMNMMMMQMSDRGSCNCLLRM